MGNAFFVVWRESLEAFLIAGILYAWLQANDASGRGKRALFLGLGAGVGLALLLGWALLGVQDGLTGDALEIFQTATLFIAAWPRAANSTRWPSAASSASPPPASPPGWRRAAWPASTSASCSACRRSCCWSLPRPCCCPASTG